jgi:hypothetical protein
MNISSVNGYSNYYNTVNFGNKTKAVQKILPKLPDFMQDAKTGTEGFGRWLSDDKEIVEACAKYLNQQERFYDSPDYYDMLDRMAESLKD